MKKTLLAALIGESFRRQYRTEREPIRGCYVGATPNSVTGVDTMGAGGPVQIGGAAATLVGFHNATPTAQGSTIASVSTSQPVVTTTPTTVFGFASSAQFNALVAAVNSMSAILQTKGLIA